MALASGIASVIGFYIASIPDAPVPNWACWYASLICLLFSFYRVWRAEAKKVDELESKYPSLQILFRSGDPAFLQDSYFGFRVRTSSPTKSARNVKVFISEIVPLGDANKKLYNEACSRIKDVPIFADPVAFVHDEKTDIHSGGSAFFPIIHRTSDKMMTFGHHLFRERCFVPTGPYRIKFRATGNDHRHAERTFMVDIRRPFVVDLNSVGEVVFDLDQSA
jgi:hypothetical protein